MTKEMSKRQLRREKMRRAEQRQRLITIGLITIGAILVAFVFIYPNLKPVGAISTAAAIERSQTEANTAGNPEAPIKIEEFSDFQCPYCRKFAEETEAQFVKAYVDTGKVYFVYRSFGEFIGKESGDAAQAAYCAGDQNKFWEMHDILFANQNGENIGDFSERRLKAFAKEIGLNTSEFNSCFNSGKYADKVTQDGKDGQAYNIQATPSFVMTYTINGESKTEMIQGAQPFSEFQSKIEAALAAMGQ